MDKPRIRRFQDRVALEVLIELGFHRNLHTNSGQLAEALGDAPHGFIKGASIVVPKVYDAIFAVLDGFFSSKAHLVGACGSRRSPLRGGHQTLTHALKGGLIDLSTCIPLLENVQGRARR